MSGNIADIERKAFKDDLHRFLEAEAEEQRREEQLEATALCMLQSAEYDPWTYEHFEEATGNAPDANRRVMFAAIAAAVDSKFINNYTNHAALTAIRQLVEGYWLSCARYQLRKQHID